MWTALLVSSIFVTTDGINLNHSSGFGAVSISSRKSTAANDTDEDYHCPSGSTIGYYSANGLTSNTVGSTTNWYIVDSLNGLKEITYEHEFNVYDDDMQLKFLRVGVPVFVRASDDKWYKIVDPSSEFRAFVADDLVVYLGTDTPKLGPDDFKPAVVAYYDERLFVPEDIELFKKQLHSRAANFSNT